MFLGCTSTGRVDIRFLWLYVQELPKAQPAVVLVLKRLRRLGNSLKSHSTDWEKPGIEPATPGLQDIGLSLHHGGLNADKLQLNNHIVLHHVYLILWMFQSFQLYIEDLTRVSISNAIY